MQSILKGKKTQFEETEQLSELDSNVVGVLELSDWKFKTTITNMLRNLINDKGERRVLYIDERVSSSRIYNNYNI